MLSIQLVFSLKKKNDSWADQFKTMEAIKEMSEYHIKNYSISQVSLEHIFNILAKEELVV